MKHILYLFFILSFTSLLTGQQKKIDSLESEFAKTSDIDQKIKLLKEIATASYLINYDKIVDAARMAEQIGSEVKHHKDLLLIRRVLGVSYTNKGEFELAKKTFHQNLKSINQLKEYKDAYMDYMNLGNVFRYNREVDSAKIYFEKSINILEKNRLREKYTSAYNNLGSFYFTNNESEKAIGYFLKAIDSSIYIKSANKVVSAYNNLGEVFRNLDNCQKAIKYTETALKISRKIEFSQGMADAYLRLANCHTILDIENDSIKFFFEKSIELYNTMNDNIYLLESYENYGEYLSKKGLHNESIIYKFKSLKLANAIGMEEKVFDVNTSIISDYLKIREYDKALALTNSTLKDTINPKNNSNKSLSELFSYKAILEEKNGNVKPALLYLKRHSKSLQRYYTIINQNTINELETKYRTEKKEKENLQLKASNAEQALLIEQENSQKLLFGFISLITITALLFFAKYARDRKKRILYKSQLDVINARQTEHEEIGTELHDNIAKKLESISLNLEKKGENEEANNIVKIKNEIRTLSKELSAVSFEESSFKEQIITLAATYHNEITQVTLSGLEDVSWETIDSPIKYNIFLIIREAVSNSYNHANAKNIDISISKNTKEIEIKIVDNGKGFDSKDIAEGKGLRNIRTRVKDINGRLKIESKKDKGTSVSVQLATT